MSSRQNSSNSKKMTSITRKLSMMEVRSRLGRYFWFDLFLLFVLCVCWLLWKEYTALGRIPSVIECRRSFGLPGHVRDFLKTTYQVKSIGGKVLLTTVCGEVFAFFAGGVCALGVVQSLLILISYPIQNHKIRKILKPLNEMAVHADKLARWTYDGEEEKYRIIENAITSIEPDEEKTLSFNDSELMGIETAMNNLIIRMRETYRQQARFVNDASHELRTPIAVIEGYANMLSRWGREDEKVLDESITAIKHESEHMNHLVEQLLFLARGDAGTTNIDKKDISIYGLMNEIYEESLMIDEKHKYRYLKMNVPDAFEGADGESDILVHADEGMLKQAVRILIDNAAKYTAEGEEIILSVGMNDEKRPYMQVQDAGKGMEAKDVEHMFERFYRADEARNTAGTGLGLSIAKWIIDKHNGHFEIISRPELGTRIRIVL